MVLHGRRVEFWLLLDRSDACSGVAFVCLIVEGLVGGMSWFLVVALICISLVTNDAVYLLLFIFVWIFCFCVLYLCIFSCVCLPRYFAFGGISFQVIYPLGCLLCCF